MTLAESVPPEQMPPEAAAVPGRRPSPLRVGPVERRAAVIVAFGSLGLSLVGALVWGLVAPGQQVVAVGDGRGIPLTNESSHEFDALGIFLCIGGVVGAVAALAAWQWQRRRGPVLALAVLAGTAVGGPVSVFFGEWIAGLRHPKPANPAPRQLLTVAPTLGSDMAFYAAPFAAALILAGLALLASRDDLGAENR